MLAAVSVAARRLLESMMEKYEYQSDFAKKYIALGKAEGKAEGERAGKAQAIVAVLTARGLAVEPAVRERILSCTDAVLLDRWLVRAATARSVNDLFADG